MADKDVVPSTSGHGNRFATNFLETPNPYSFECSRTTPPSTIQQIPPIRLEVIRKRFEDRGLSTEVINLLLVSPRGNTSAAYQSVWNTWYHWNMEWHSDPLCNNWNTILQFLTDSFSLGLSYSSINTYRSMLSMTLEPVEGFNIGEHPLIVQLLKGCFNSNPPLPRYKKMWDPDIVLLYFSSLPDNGDLLLVIISQKLVTLIALATLLRVSEISAISLPSINISCNSFVNFFSRPRKYQRSGPLCSFTLPRTTGPSCPVECLEAYLSLTKDCRFKTGDSLFISLKRSFRPVGASTLGRWIKTYLFLLCCSL